ncbi:MAG TPA: protein kinase [Myxococcaceae bacterium]|nr:protein kinase [Myxococcaceae bacterium]
MEAWHAEGAYGAVYRAVRVGQEDQGPVALKFSRYPWDMRFMREAELLSRLSHPGIPRLLDRGVARHVSGVEHPWLVMEWVEGTPLYAWAEKHKPSIQDLCQVLAQLARTLEAIHAAGAVHRDVKGDNVLVRLSDRRPVLIDLGSGYFQGATRLTWQSLPPGTPAYLSVQACRFEIGLARNRDSYYAPSPADDLFALGVTAYRLVMGEYPQPMDALEDEEGAWHVISPDIRTLLENNLRLPQRLREVILRLFSETPEARGTAAQAAEALEAAAAERVKERPPETPLSAPPRALVPAWVWKPGLALAVAGACAVLLWSWQPTSAPAVHLSESPPQSSAAHAPDAGTSAVGDSTPDEPQASPALPTEKKPITQEPLPEPRPGQARPDEKGRCPNHKQVLINGGCWLEQLPMTAEECTVSGYVPFKGKCYVPALAPPKKPLPTTSPAEER